jgi:hypothetical protein
MNATAMSDARLMVPPFAKLQDHPWSRLCEIIALI